MPVTSPSRIILPIQRKQISSDGWMLNLLSKNIATITSPQGLRQTAYFGFENSKAASEFLDKSKFKTYVFDFISKPFRYEQVSEDQLKTLCTRLKQADWIVEDCTKVAQFFNRIVGKNK